MGQETAAGDTPSGPLRRSEQPESDRADPHLPEPEPAIPEATLTRLSAYLHVLRAFGERGVMVASSGELATAAGVNPSILRKDLSHIGATGVRGVGYDVSRLTARISIALHVDDTRTVALAGAGTLGRTLLAHTGLGRGFRVTAMFDDDPALIGSSVADGGPVIASYADIVAVCGNGAGIEFGVIATEPADAQRVCDAFAEAGVSMLLNVTSTSVSAGSGTVVRALDLALELQMLALRGARSRVAGESGPGADVGASASVGTSTPGMASEETVTA